MGGAKKRKIKKKRKKEEKEKKSVHAAFCSEILREVGKVWTNKKGGKGEKKNR